MHLKLSAIAMASILTIAACGGDDDEPADGGGDGSVKDAGGEDSGSESDSGTGDAG